MRARYNVAVVGKTGVGKSSFINYLYGAEVKEVSNSRPVEHEGFESVDMELDGLAIRIFDSYGLEADKAEQWLADLEEELAKRSIEEDIEDWFHTIFYCIGTGKARIEEYELEIISKFLEENYQVQIVFTKADQNRGNQLQQLKELIKAELEADLTVLEVCSEEKELLSGKKIEPRGRKEAIKAIKDGFWDSILGRLPPRCEVQLLAIVSDYFAELREKVKTELGLLNQRRVIEDLQADLKSFVTDLSEQRINELVLRNLREMVNLFSSFAESLTGISQFERDFECRIQFPDFDDLTRKMIDLGIIGGVAGGMKLAGGGMALKALAGGKIAGLALLKGVFLPALPIIAAGLLIKKGYTEDKILDSLEQAEESIKKEIREIGPEIENIVSEVKEDYDRIEN
ncbi:GTPase domain-containing protein [Fuchsiella alkaliacetigena]|uniref:GTPase domain-containing protein n=1 Tax=Fuchsiella alkaliacetigena TaxID=957042 RepID=UPI00200AB60D|nr:GTPase [Fuchsiella alkaliacetigena]MCK8824963.1 50S ribosome-binding GTPase [Fuchsiella alkaliacetigena]